MSGFIKTKSVGNNILGIDLGTTNTLASIIKNKIPIMIKNEFNKPSIPSIVNYSKDRSIVGEEAKKLLNKDPKNTIFSAKRLIGRNINDDVFEKSDNYLKRLPYLTTKSCTNDKILVKTDYRKLLPERVSAEILKNVKAYTTKYLNKEIKNVVITVPAYFDDTQRQATKEAGRLAGLNVVRIVNEPTAAALAYGLDKSSNGFIAVYDLGGGTFDISILEIIDGIFHVKSTNGDTFLGGDDFDSEFMKFLVNLFNQREGINIENNPPALRKLKIEAEAAKMKLSTSTNADIFIENVIDGVDFDLSVTRSQYESIIKRIGQRTITPCEKAIKDAGISKKDISNVILVGGMTKTPYIRELVEMVFEQKPKTDINPDEAVAKGAAIQAGILEGSVKDLLLLDVIPLSLGIETLGGVFSKIIHRNTTLPFKYTETFTTSKDGQTDVEVNVYQGERGLVSNNKCLGKLLLSNIPKAKKGVPKINVSFEADANGILKVFAEDSLTKKRQKLEIKPTSDITTSEIDEMIESSKKHEKEDEEIIKRVNFKNNVIEELSKYIKEDIKIPENIKEKLKMLEFMIEKENFDIKKAEKLKKDIESNL